MNFNKDEYMPRLIDKKLDDYLKVFGALSVEGPKWCGKTWTSSHHAKSAVYLDDEETKEKALLDLELVLNEEQPELIDEWHLVPKIWDKVRRKCDEDSNKGKYILTCSTELNDEAKKEVFHSGAGRIGKIKMYTMSLYESGDSTGEASLTAMLEDKQKNVNVKIPSLKELANLIVRGGWPSNIKVDSDKVGLIPKSYIESILDKDMNDDKKRDKNKMRMLLKSLSRNESTVVSNETLIKDIEDYENREELIESRITLRDYLDVLDRLHIIENQEAYSENYRSKERIGKSPKRHLTDPSLVCASLNLNDDKLLKDLKTFGFLFESLVERDLRIYIEYLGGHLYHFRDNVTGLEVDSILEFSNGDYAAIEIKLGYNAIDTAKKELLRFYDNMITKPKFMCIITGNFTSVVKDKETGIYIVPITALRP
ncbi:MAG TPA: ATP-binding protein [Candidatus Onthousia faecavium]|nr:ATP-binding protein [Candidatus Onthousia faecavium]